MRVGVLARNLALRIGLRELLNGSAEIDVVAEIADLDELDTLGVSLDILVAAELAGAELRELADEADAALLLLTDEEMRRRLYPGQGCSLGGFCRSMRRKTNYWLQSMRWEKVCGLALRVW